MPRDGAIVFRDLVGKLEVLHLASYTSAGSRAKNHPCGSVLRINNIAFVKLASA